MHQPDNYLFYDNHGQPACPDIGENCNAKKSGA